MNIVEALKDKDNYLRISYDNKWLYWDGDNQIWVVRKSVKGHPSIVLIDTEDEEKAVECLLGEDNG